jgi:uncharacterized integral membrane protein
VNAALRWLPLLGVTLAAGLFAWFNRGERVVLGLGFATLYRVPLTFVVALAFLAGMLAMLVLSLRQDLALRRALRARGLLDGAAEPAPRVPAEPVFSARTDEERTEPFGAGPVPEAESAAIRVVPPDPPGTEGRFHAEDAERD